MNKNFNQTEVYTAAGEIAEKAKQNLDDKYSNATAQTVLDALRLQNGVFMSTIAEGKATVLIDDHNRKNKTNFKLRTVESRSRNI